MKELSIEEKAKRYDEAIERARDWSETKNGYYTPKELCEEIFPELKVLDDERTRKELIQHLTLEMEVELTLGKEDGKRWIAWLEKQGELNML